MDKAIISAKVVVDDDNTKEKTDNKEKRKNDSQIIKASGNKTRETMTSIKNMIWH